MNPMTIKLNDSEVRTAIALYLQRQHPDHQIADIELSWEEGRTCGYIEPGTAVAEIELLPKLEISVNV